MKRNMITAIICSAYLMFYTSSDSFAREPFFKQINVFESGTEGYDYFRSPAVVCNLMGNKKILNPIYY